LIKRREKHAQNTSVQLRVYTTARNNKSEFTVGVTVCVRIKTLTHYVVETGKYCMIHTEEKAQRNVPIDQSIKFNSGSLAHMKRRHTREKKTTKHYTTM